MLEPSPEIQRLLSQEERLRLMRQLMRIVRETGQHVLNMQRKEIFDTIEVRRHQFSTVDAEAGSHMHGTVARVMGTFHGTILEESEIPQALVHTEQLTWPLLIGDAVEGSTNAKRGLAAFIRRPIFAGTSAMILESEELGTVAASAFYDFASRKTFASVRTDSGSFLASLEKRILFPENIHVARGDSHTYAIVPGYSHHNIRERASIEEALQAAGIESAGGSRSSAQDLVNLLANQVDAYIDLRALFTGSTDSRDETLHAWDVGGLLPVLDALGFRITDALGKCWQKMRFSEHLALVVTRPALLHKVLDALQSVPCVARQSAPADSSTVPFPTSTSLG